MRWIFRFGFLPPKEEFQHKEVKSAAAKLSYFLSQIRWELRFGFLPPKRGISAQGSEKCGSKIKLFFSSNSVGIKVRLLSPTNVVFPNREVKIAAAKLSFF